MNDGITVAVFFIAKTGHSILAAPEYTRLVVSFGVGGFGQPALHNAGWFFICRRHDARQRVGMGDWTEANTA